MSTRNNAKRKAKRSSQESNSDEPVSNLSRLENNENVLSSEQFEEITKNVKNSLQRDIKDAVSAVEMRILQAIKENGRSSAPALSQDVENPGLPQSQPGNSNFEFVRESSMSVNGMDTSMCVSVCSEPVQTVGRGKRTRASMSMDYE